MADKGKLELKLTDVFGGRIRELVTANLRHLELSEHKVAKGLNAAGLIRINRGCDGRLEVIIVSG